MTILSPAAVPARPQALVVDDDRINLLIYEAILRKGGFDVSTAGSGREALALTAAKPPDLVLVDLMMPEMKGTDVARLMRAQRGMGRVPIFMLTASSDSAHVEEAFQAGVDDYLVKPVDRAMLLAKVRSRLTGAGPPSTAPGRPRRCDRQPRSKRGARRSGPASIPPSDQSVK